MYQPVSRRPLDMYMTEQELDFLQILKFPPISVESKHFSKLNLVFEKKPKVVGNYFFQNEEIFINDCKS